MYVIQELHVFLNMFAEVLAPSTHSTQYYDFQVVIEEDPAFSLLTALGVPQQLQDSLSELGGGRLTEVQHLSKEVQQQLSSLVSFSETLCDIHVRLQLVALVGNPTSIQNAFDICSRHTLTDFLVAQLAAEGSPQLSPATLTRHQNNQEFAILVKEALKEINGRFWIFDIVEHLQHVDEVGLLGDILLSPLLLKLRGRHLVPGELDVL